MRYLKSAVRLGFDRRIATMRKTGRRSLFPVVLSLFLCLPVIRSSAADRSGPHKAPRRVACVGDSITYGAGIKNRAKNCYPVRLGRLLGPGYGCRNFGVNGATMLKRGDKPYWKQKAFREAIARARVPLLHVCGTADTVVPSGGKHRYRRETLSETGRGNKSHPETRNEPPSPQPSGPDSHREFHSEAYRSRYESAFF